MSPGRRWAPLCATNPWYRRGGHRSQSGTACLPRLRSWLGRHRRKMTTRCDQYRAGREAGFHHAQGTAGVGVGRRVLSIGRQAEQVQTRIERGPGHPPIQRTNTVAPACRGAMRKVKGPCSSCKLSRPVPGRASRPRPGCPSAIGLSPRRCRRESRPTFSGDCWPVGTSANDSSSGIGQRSRARR